MNRFGIAVCSLFLAASFVGAAPEANAQSNTPQSPTTDPVRQAHEQGVWISSIDRSFNEALNSSECSTFRVFVRHLEGLNSAKIQQTTIRLYNVYLTPARRQEILRHRDARLAELRKRECPPRAGTQTAAEAARVQAFIAAGGILADLPKNGFLARELQGSGVQQLNQVTPTRSASGASGQFKIEVDNAPRPRDRFYFVFNYHNMDASSSGGAFDPGAGFRLNIPGPTGGASGFSLGANPLNRVESIFYDNSIESFGGGGGMRLPLFIFSAPTGISVDSIIGFGVNRLTMDERFGGRIPGFARDFFYTTDVNVNSATLDLGLGLTQVVRLPGGGFFVINGETVVTPGYYSASGTDRLNFTGFDPSFIDLSETKTDVGVRIGGGFNFGFPGSGLNGNQIVGPSIFVQGGYESRPGFPVIVRDGTNPSRIDLKRADIFTVSGGVSIPFGAPPPAIDVESQPLQRQSQQRSQFMETYPGVREKYNQPARGAIQGGSR
jgi:hypothetical protein